MRYGPPPNSSYGQLNYIITRAVSPIINPYCAVCGQNDWAVTSQYNLASRSLYKSPFHSFILKQKLSAAGQGFFAGSKAPPLLFCSLALNVAIPVCRTSNLRMSWCTVSDTGGIRILFVLGKHSTREF